MTKASSAKIVKMAAASKLWKFEIRTSTILLVAQVNEDRAEDVGVDGRHSPCWRRRCMQTALSAVPVPTQPEDHDGLTVSDDDADSEDVAVANRRWLDGR
jgi:hypothetical protein